MNTFHNNYNEGCHLWSSDRRLRASVFSRTGGSPLAMLRESLHPVLFSFSFLSFGVILKYHCRVRIEDKTVETVWLLISPSVCCGSPFVLSGCFFSSLFGC